MNNPRKIALEMMKTELKNLRQDWMMEHMDIKIKDIPVINLEMDNWIEMINQQLNK